MAVSPGFRTFVEELFAPVGGVTLRRMFSGFGVFRDGLMFGLVIGDVLYLKADETTRPEFETEGSVPFSYTGGKGREVVVTSHWRLPERLFDEPDDFREWALAAFAVAERAKTSKPDKPKRKSGKSKPAPR